MPLLRSWQLFRFKFVIREGQNVNQTIISEFSRKLHWDGRWNSQPEAGERTSAGKDGAGERSASENYVAYSLSRPSLYSPSPPAPLYLLLRLLWTAPNLTFLLLRPYLRIFSLQLLAGEIHLLSQCSFRALWFRQWIFYPSFILIQVHHGSTLVLCVGLGKVTVHERFFS